MNQSEVRMKMNEMGNSPVCEHADELIAVLYGEANERERREFESHLQQCGDCRAEFGSFAQVRESIHDWRDEALAGFVATETQALAAASAPTRKSAVAALRQFFDLSPLWMKGAVGFAALVFCVLAVLAFMRLGTADDPSQIAKGNPEASYTKQDVERAVQEAVAKEREQLAAQPEQAIVAESPTPKDENVGSSNTATPVKTVRKSRRPFSRAEREQLAADLRLLGDDDRDMYLWADPNQ
jgi:anti-sigma factor RsiW